MLHRGRTPKCPRSTAPSFLCHDLLAFIYFLTINEKVTFEAGVIFYWILQDFSVGGTIRHCTKYVISCITLIYVENTCFSCSYRNYKRQFEILSKLPFFHENKCFTTKIRTIYLLVFHCAFSREDSIRYCARGSKRMQLWLLSRIVFCAKWKVILSRATFF